MRRERAWARLLVHMLIGEPAATPGSRPDVTGHRRFRAKCRRISDVMKQQRDARKTWTARLARSDRANDARCANCNASVPVEPCESGYSAAGVLEHTWHCVACGNRWGTSVEGMTT